MSKDVRIGGYFSKPKSVRGQNTFSNMDVKFWVCLYILHYICSLSLKSMNMLQLTKSRKPPLIENTSLR